jgi:hypothetical protein
MSKAHGAAQSDLFAAEAGDVSTGGEPPPESFVARIRDELTATLARVTAADTLPWADGTKALLAEMRFHSVAKWLPESEAAELCNRFEAAMARLYGEDHLPREKSP